MFQEKCTLCYITFIIFSILKKVVIYFEKMRIGVNIEVSKQDINDSKVCVKQLIQNLPIRSGKL